MKNLFDLSDKNILITGGLGQLAKQFTKTLLQYNSTVILLDIVDEKLVDLDKLFGNEFQGNKILYVQANITDKSELKAVALKLEAQNITIDVLINNAAIDSPPNSGNENNARFENYPDTLLDKVIDVNLKGSIYCCQVFGEIMAKKGKGSIINISSIYGMLSPNQDIYEYKRTDGTDWFKPVGYPVTKAAILNLTRYLSTYWASSGVRVNTITPSGVFNNQDQQFLDEYCKRIPMKRMANIDELDGAVIYLASNASSFVTGSNLVVDGGWTAW